MTLNLIIPLLTYHTNDIGFNNSNHGIGVESKHNNHRYSITVVESNSNGDVSTYVSALYNKQLSKNISILTGVSVASGYENSPIFPVLSAQFYRLF